MTPNLDLRAARRTLGLVSCAMFAATAWTAAQLSPSSIGVGFGCLPSDQLREPRRCLDLGPGGGLERRGRGGGGGGRRGITPSQRSAPTPTWGSSHSTTFGSRKGEPASIRRRGTPPQDPARPARSHPALSSSPTTPFRRSTAKRYT